MQPVSLLRITVAGLLLWLWPGPGPGLASDEEPEDRPKPVMSLKAMLSHDLSDKPLTFPANVTAEPDQQEIYVVDGGKGQIIIFDRDFHPHFTLGAGRGIDSPQCVFFDATEGRVFVGQHGNGQHPARLTILNAAFLPEKEVNLSQLPQAADFSPINGVVAQNGRIYLAGALSRRILVLDSNANFSHWLQVKDTILQNRVKTTDSQVERQQALVKLKQAQAAPATTAELTSLPETLRPGKGRDIPRSPSQGNGLQPILIHDVESNSEGHLFFLSEETSKVYVFNPGEKMLFSFGDKGGSSSKMSRPRGLAIDERRKCIYVVDYMRHTILVYSMAGRFIFEFGGRGQDELWFNFPTAIDVDDQGRLMVADLFNNRVQVLDSDFKTSYPVFGNKKVQE